MAEPPRRIATHREPIWRDRSNFVISIDLPDHGGKLWREQLWAEQVTPCRFRLCCIPFFAYDLALGDVVETDDGYIVQRVVEPSGRYVFRVWFGSSFHPRDEVVDRLIDAGALAEWSSKNLVAIDCVDEDHAEAVAGILVELEQQQALELETGRS